VSGLVHAYLQTRGTGRAGDYTFLGAAPTEPWWRTYRDATAFDHPTVLVTSDGERWAAYLSGIPSTRSDAVGTTVRYTLVLDGPCGAAETGCVVAAVAAWLDDVAAGPDRPGGRVSSALDSAFPAELVDRMISKPFPGGGGGVTHPSPRYCTDASIVHGHLLDALASLPVPPPADDVPGSWVGGTASTRARAAFRARTGLLLAGTPGRALLLNLLGGKDDAVTLLDPASPVAVLVESADPPVPSVASSVVEAKKATAPPARGAGVVAVAGIAVLPLVVLFVLLTTTALVVTLVLWLL
jgi:hypothetical protein